MDVTAAIGFVSVDVKDAELEKERYVSTAEDDELVLTAFNPEDYEYTMFLQFVDPSVEKEYLHNAKFKVGKTIISRFLCERVLKALTKSAGNVSQHFRRLFDLQRNQLHYADAAAW
jgi:hypothetical protein